MSNRETAERPVPIGARLYKKHRKIINKWKKKFDVSEAEVVRRALETYDLHAANGSKSE